MFRVSEFLIYRSKQLEFLVQLKALKKYLQLYYSAAKTNSDVMTLQGLMQLLKVVWKDHRRDNLVNQGKPWPQKLFQKFIETVTNTEIQQNFQKAERIIDVSKVLRFIDLYTLTLSNGVDQNSQQLQFSSLYLKSRKAHMITEQSDIKLVISDFLAKVKTKTEVSNAEELMSFFNPRYPVDGVTFEGFKYACEALGMRKREKDLQRVFYYLDMPTRDGSLTLNDLESGFFSKGHTDDHSFNTL